ncbi:DUF3239 domain-containing protein [Corynebacterium ulceribovis]|uniref:DUF3239 domain-containing protein n=1 Tax=Corynebacterium ulceribovis TaxID=487732 RepID=UPI0003800026|nr:DUF3239 domain-containing protein [Corynebacterium ulceribovis]
MSDFSFTVDPEFNAANNEYSRDTKRMQASALVLAVLLVAGAVAVVLFNDGAPWAWMAAIMLGVMALVFLALIPVIPKKTGTAQQVFDNYPLVPAMVAEVRDRDMTIMALVNMAVEPTAPPRPALALRTVTALPGHARRKGEKVPAVAVAGRRSVRAQEVWDQISPMPIAWGTPDRKVVADAIAHIDGQQWHTLRRNLDRVADVRATKFDLLPLD